MLGERLQRGPCRSLGEQLCRAAVSVPSNIAEGNARLTARDYLRCLRIANGSLAELDTQLRLARRGALVPTADVERALAAAAEVGRLLGGLMRSIRRLVPERGANARGAGTRVRRLVEDRETR